jgi:hypothetical protein
MLLSPRRRVAPRASGGDGRRRDSGAEQAIHLALEFGAEGEDRRVLGPAAVHRQQVPGHAGETVRFPRALKAQAQVQRVAGVRAGLEDRRAADELIDDMVVVAAEDQVEDATRGERAVLGEAAVGEADDGRRALGAQGGRLAPRGFEQFAEADVRPRLGEGRRLGRDQADETDGHAGDGAQFGGPHRRQRRLGHQVRREPGKARLGETFAQHDGAEVELVVAGHGEVHAQRVPRRHHLAALEQARFDARRERVAAEDEQRGRRLPLDFAHQGRQPRQAAARPLGVDGRDLVDVVDVDEADLDGPVGGMSRQRAGEAEEKTGEKDGRAEGHGGQGENDGGENSRALSARAAGRARNR